MQRFFYLLIGIAFYCASFTTSANYDVDFLEKSIRHFLQSHTKLAPFEQITVHLPSLTTHHRQLSCSVPFTIKFSRSTTISRNTNLTVSCHGKQYWRNYINATVMRFTKVQISTKPLAKGHTIAKEDVAIALLPNHQLRGGHLTPDRSILGTKLMRPHANNKPFTHQDLCYVCKGDKITIEASGDFVQLHAQGEALQDGGLNEQIPIKNLRSGKVIQAKVDGVGMVVIRL